MWAATILSPVQIRVNVRLNMFARPFLFFYPLPMPLLKDKQNTNNGDHVPFDNLLASLCKLQNCSYKFVATFNPLFDGIKVITNKKKQDIFKTPKYIALTHTLCLTTF